MSPRSAIEDFETIDCSQHSFDSTHNDVVPVPLDSQNKAAVAALIAAAGDNCDVDSDDETDSYNNNNNPSAPRSCLRKNNKRRVTEVMGAPLRRRVHFNSSNYIFNPAPEFYSDEDIDTKWWNGDDLVALKTNAKNQSLRIRKASKITNDNNNSGTGCSLTMAHKKLLVMLEGDFIAIKATEGGTPEQDLQTWCSFEDGRRGLERFASRDYSGYRRQDVRSVRGSVVAEQTLQWSRGTSDADALARVSLDGSRRARTFAHFMAQADAKEARTIYEEDHYKNQEQQEASSYHCASSANPDLALAA